MPACQIVGCAPGEPSHIEAKIVQPAQKDVGGDSSYAEALEQIICLALDDDLAQEGKKGLVFRNRCPALAILTTLHLDERVERIAPGTLCDTAVCSCEVGLGDLEVEERLTLSRVLGLKDFLSFVPGNFPQAGSFAGLVVDAVIALTAVSAADESVAFFHAIGAIAMLNESIPPPLASSRRVGAGSRKVVEEADFWCPFWCPLPS